MKHNEALPKAGVLLARLAFLGWSEPIGVSAAACPPQRGMLSSAAPEPAPPEPTAGRKRAESATPLCRPA